MTNDRKRRSGTRIIEALAESTEKLISLAVTIKAAPGIAKVYSGFNCRRYVSGVFLEVYVDATFNNGEAFTWWIDARMDGSKWSVEPQIFTMVDGVQEVLQELPQSQALSASEMLDCLSLALVQLTNHAVVFVERRRK